MAKNKVPASFAVAPELLAEVTDYCEKKGISRSDYIGMLLVKAIKLPIDDEPMVMSKPEDNVIPIVLKLPRSLKGDKEGLEEWMHVQTSGIISKLANV